MSVASGDARAGSLDPVRLSRRWFWLAGSALTAALVLREPGHFLNPQFWAEDASVLFNQSWEEGFVRSLVTPASGYLYTFGRLVAGLALLLPLSWAPLVFNLAACAVQALPIFYLLSGRLGRYLPSPLARLAAAAIYVAAPNSYETYVNLANSQSNLALAALLVLLADRPASRRVQAAELCLLAVFGLTGPFGIVLLPVAAWTLLAGRRDGARGWRIATAAVLAAGAVVQLPIMAISGRVAADAGGPVTLSQWLQIISTHVFYNSVLGIERMTDARWAADLAANRGAQLLAVAVVGVLIAFVIRRRHRALGGLLYLAGATVALSFLFPSNGLEHWLAPSFGPRYYLYATLFVLYATLLLCLRGGPLRWLGAALAVPALTVGIPGDFQYERHLDTRWADQVAVFESLPGGERLRIPVQPSPHLWFTLRKKIGERRAPPLAGLRRRPGELAHGVNQPAFRERGGAQHVQLSGWVSSTHEDGNGSRVWLAVDGRLYPALQREFCLGRSDAGGGPDRHYLQFHQEIPLEELRPGRHRVSVAVLDPDRTAYRSGVEKQFGIVVDGPRLVTTEVR
ncbi:MAG TPA: hypothetical protein VI078_04555 [bacterium]